MQRGRFFALGAITASGLLIVPRHALAQVPVFDAAGFAKLIEQLTTQGLIKAATAKTALQTFQIYQEAVTQHRIDIDQIWDLVKPDVDKMLSNVEEIQDLGLTSQDIFGFFRNKFPTYKPEQPFGVIYDKWLDSYQHQAKAAMSVAQRSIEAAKERDAKRAKILGGKRETQNTILESSLQIAATQSQATDNLLTTNAAAYSSQNGFYTTMLSFEAAKQQDPGAERLRSTFYDSSKRIRDSQVKQSQRRT